VTEAATASVRHLRQCSTGEAQQTTAKTCARKMARLRSLWRGSSLRGRDVRRRARTAIAWSAQRVRGAGSVAGRGAGGSQRSTRPARRSRCRQDRAVGVPGTQVQRLSHSAGCWSRVRDGARICGAAPTLCVAGGPDRRPSEPTARFARDSIRPEQWRGPGSLPGEPGSARPALRGGRAATGRLRRGRRAVARPSLGGGAWLRGAPRAG
jgi:hypothetical protein